MRVSPRPDRVATLKNILVYYDEPQLALMHTDRDLDMLALAVEGPDETFPFFACSVRKRTLDKYIEGEFDLNYVFRNAEYGHYTFDWKSMASDFSVPIKRATNSEMMNEDFYPESGFFARSHTYQLPDQTAETPATTHEFLIDGSWKAQEFSKFYAQISDLYGFYFLASSVTERSVIQSEMQFAQQAVNKHFWRGGGSYVQFFRDLADHIGEEHPLKVSRIQYASPGKIDLAGNRGVLKEIDQLIHLVGANRERLSQLYRQIDKVLSAEGLKKARPDTRFSGQYIEEYVFSRTKDLVSGLNITDSARLYEVCSDNKVLFAKVALAIFRRAHGLYLFHAQGRVRPST